MKFKFRNTIALAPNSETGEGGGVSPESQQTTETTQQAQTTEAGDDLSGLKNALKAERSRASDFERELKALKMAFEGIDPQAAKAAQERLKQMKEQQEEWNQRENKLKNTLAEEYERKVGRERETASKWQAQYNDLLKRTVAEKAYQANGGRNGGSEDGVTFFDTFYTNISNSLRLNDKGQLEIINPADPTGARVFSKKSANEPMAIGEFFSNFVGHPVFGHYFAAQGNSRGGGMQPGSGGTPRPGSVRVIDRNDHAALAEPGVLEAIAKGDGSVVIR